MSEAKPNEKGVPTLSNGHNLVETGVHYVLYRPHDEEDEPWQPGVVSMKSTALKKSRRLNSLISQQVIPGTQQQAPRWLYKWQMTTVKEQKDDKVWSNFEFERQGMVNKVEYEKARSLYKAFSEGRVRGDDTGDTGGDEIPF